MKRKNINKIELLIEKYLEGFTTLKEEQQLRKYFQQKNVAEHLEMYKPVFMFFESEIKQRHRVKHFVLNWKTQATAVAAACLVLMFGIKLFFDTDTISETSIAYINGKKYTDRELIKAETLESLNNISTGNTDAYSVQFEAIEQFFDKQ
ncbi:MAG: hypothetical protein LBT56_03405 [Prevotellaceae bacterium]|jgi:hypothetical protein|nr:hypothetical protein [Prevotellaceae bacterium]